MSSLKIKTVEVEPSSIFFQQGNDEYRINRELFELDVLTRLEDDEEDLETTRDKIIWIFDKFQNEYLVRNKHGIRFNILRLLADYLKGISQFLMYTHELKALFKALEEDGYYFDSLSEETQGELVYKLYYDAVALVLVKKFNELKKGEQNG